MKNAARLMTIAGLAAGTAFAAMQDEYPEQNSPEWREIFAMDVADTALGSSPVAEAPGLHRYSVTFKGEIGWFDVGRIFLDTAANAEGYLVDYKMEQKGVARWFSDAEAESQGIGTFTDGVIDTSYYFNHDYESDEDQRKVEIFRTAPDSRIRLWVEPLYDFYEPISMEIAEGAVDPMAALLLLAFSEVPAGQSPCDRVVKVFDGRRRFDLIMRDDGKERFKSRGNDRFEGETFRCKLTQEKVKGYREKDKGDIDGDLWVYLAAVPEGFDAPNFAYVPVMVKGRQGILTAWLEGKNPTITRPDGQSINLGK